MEYTDRLIESYLIENYISIAAKNEQDRQTAENNFINELYNGPKKQVGYRNGKAQFVSIGSFDLENFHKAFDEEFEKQNLLSLFYDDGKLIRRSSYGIIKDLDKSVPAFKYLSKLWGVQFGGDGLKFLSDKLATEKLQKQEEELKKGIPLEIVDILNKDQQWQKLNDLHDKKLKIDVEVNRFGGDKADIILKINGLLIPPNIPKSKYGVFSIGVSDINTTNSKEVANKLCKAFLSEVQRYINNREAISFVLHNFELFRERPEFRAGAVSTDYNETVFYFDNGALYKTKIITIHDSDNKSYFGLILLDANTGEKTAVELLHKFKLVALKNESSNDNLSGSWHDESVSIYYNPEFGEDILRKIGVKQDYNNNGKTAQQDYALNANTTDSKYKPFFKKYYYSVYVLDSSD